MRRHTRKTTKKYVKIVGIVVLVLLGLKLIQLGFKYTPLFYQLTFKHDITLKKTPDQKINLLLLGIGGGTHEGPNLSDTIIFASIDPNTKKTTLVSIPRDLWIPDLKAKINSAYATGQDKQPGGGLMLAKAVVSKIVGQDIDYGVRIDFSGFTRAVDMVGGLDIQVDNTLDDYAYPVEGKETETCGHNTDEVASLSAQLATGSATELEAFPCRYEHLHVDKGIQHMDGATALKFVRSRHALGPEGSDFARSRRQGKVIAAFKDKIFSAQTLLNPVRMLSLYNVLKDSIDTDIQQDEFDDFFRLAQKMKGGTLQSAVIDYGDSTTDRAGLLVNPLDLSPYGGAWVLIPRVGSTDYTEIHDFVQCEITNGDCIVPKTPGSGITTPVPSVVISPKK